MPDSLPKIPLLGFDHATLVVDDLRRTREFYADGLGMAEAPRPAFDFAGLWFQLGSVQLHVIQASTETGLPGPVAPPPKRASRGQHLAFEVADMESTLKALRAHGIGIAQGPQQRVDGSRQVFVRDPDGHVVELYCRRARSGEPPVETGTSPGTG